MNQIKEKFQIKNWELVSINPNNKNWEWDDYFCFWAVSFQSVIGFSLIASFYLLYDLNSVIVFLGCLLAVLLTGFFSNLINLATWFSMNKPKPKSITIYKKRAVYGIPPPESI